MALGFTTLKALLKVALLTTVSLVAARTRAS
jgi:hypothetical protein